MNTFKNCIPCVCTSSGRKRVCEEHNIGAQCGTTTTNTATKTFEHSDAKSIQKNLQNQQNQLNIQTKLKYLQNQQKFIRQLEVVPSPAEVCQNDPIGYQAAAFVPSKVPRWRRPLYLNILIPEHQYHPSYDQGQCHGQRSTLCLIQLSVK